MRIGQFGRVPFDEPQRRFVVRRLLPVDDDQRRILDREIQLLPLLVAGDAPRPMRRHQHPVGRGVAARFAREHRHPVLRVVVGDVDVERLRVDVRAAHHLGFRVGSANDAARLSDRHVGRRVVAARVLDDAEEVLVGHDHHVVFGVDRDRAEGGACIFDVARRLLVDLALPRLRLISRCPRRESAVSWAAAASPRLPTLRSDWRSAGRTRGRCSSADGFRPRRSPPEGSPTPSPASHTRRLRAATRRIRFDQCQ